MKWTNCPYTFGTVVVVGIVMIMTPGPPKAGCFFTPVTRRCLRADAKPGARREKACKWDVDPPGYLGCNVGKGSVDLRLGIG